MTDIVIAIPNDVGQQWTLIGPSGEHAESTYGPVTLRNVPDGDGSYTVYWGLVSGYAPPVPSFDEVSVTGTHEFTSPVYVVAETNISAVWANSGGDKVTQDETRYADDPATTLSPVWNGTTISIFGGRNEVVEFNLVLEAFVDPAADITVTMNGLTGPGGTIAYDDGRSDLFDWTTTEIELFVIRYLPILGLSFYGYDGKSYDERHVPEKMRAPYTGNGIIDPGAAWADRPNASKFYPEIAVPIELYPTGFNIAQGENQSVWCDVYIPKTATAGTYTGNVTITETGMTPIVIPVSLDVMNYELSDVPAVKTMAFLEAYDVAQRFTTEKYPAEPSAEHTAALAAEDNCYKVAHRHGISLFGGVGIDIADDGTPWATREPQWADRLDGTLFTGASGYAGPGVGEPNNLYVIGPYGSWQNAWDTVGGTDFEAKLDDWAAALAPYSVDKMIYIADEFTSGQYAEVQQWCAWMDAGAGAGSSIPRFGTVKWHNAVTSIPDLTAVSQNAGFAHPTEWSAALTTLQGASKEACMYNGTRPLCGSWMTEDDGVSPRMIPWAQSKLGIDRWFNWSATYWESYQFISPDEHTQMFTRARTFGSLTGVDPVEGEEGFGYSNGNGVLFYPGTDNIHAGESYGIPGPISSLRLKYWRRGVQDAGIIALATAKDSPGTTAIVDARIPTVLWEVGVDDLGDPTYKVTDIPWSTDPDDWETSRLALADIIEFT